ncbi:hypothetical protein [Nocardiopsis suaedae]|uniref:DUF320 domain-containing protein n=1 Tax=Nocardiopsis suaedae TaxID=3018444 RepID=A0ABT4TTB7_9ACTN|nr:hypothetical protein [Nocardiopsis suaedae]MDA2807933.1 hypothetical protein [Nocardiopsis suaedae]
MKKAFAVAALTAAAFGAAAPAYAGGYGGDGHHHNGGGDSYALINGDVAPCAIAPWNWEGPLNILSVTGDYNACQKIGVTHGG